MLIDVLLFRYGLLTFGRYLGAWAEYGWAWNHRPQRNQSSIVPSAEFVECFVIFLYGVSNTWMERFGAAPGSPYTVKQVQHISIAVMFWFCGLIGMAIEWAPVKTWLGATVVGKKGRNTGEGPTHSASFNPFPALVIGVVSSKA